MSARECAPAAQPRPDLRASRWALEYWRAMVSVENGEAAHAEAAEGTLHNGRLHARLFRSDSIRTSASSWNSARNAQSPQGGGERERIMDRLDEREAGADVRVSGVKSNGAVCRCNKDWD